MSSCYKAFQRLLGVTLNSIALGDDRLWSGALVVDGPPRSRESALLQTRGDGYKTPTCVRCACFR